MNRTPVAVSGRIAVSLLALACGTDHGQPRAPDGNTGSAGSYTWTESAPPGSGVFPEEWAPGKWPTTLLPVQAFEGKLWMTAQTFAWSSADGLNWSRHPKADWGERISLAFAYFDDKLWLFGGMKLPDDVFQNDIWFSPDGENWQPAGQAAWPPRKGHTVVSFNSNLWLFGGANHVAPDKISDQFLNDVWTSQDGLNWTEVTPAAPWSPREYPRVLVFGGSLYLLGGQGHADVWRSVDGKSWTLLNPEAPWQSRYDYGAGVFDGKLWVYGGRELVSTNAFNDVWHSPDAIAWTRQVDDAPWSDRSGVHSIVFMDKLWLFSGKHTGATDNWAGDIWTMHKAP